MVQVMPTAGNATQRAVFRIPAVKGAGFGELQARCRLDDFIDDGLCVGRARDRVRRGLEQHQLLRARGSPAGCSLLPLSGDFVEPPIENYRDGRPTKKESVDGGPLPRVFYRVGVVVDAGRIERAHHSMLAEHKGEEEQEGDPVLIERDYDDHDEIEEVKLDEAAREMDEHGGRHKKAEAAAHGAKAPTKLGRAGQYGERGDRGCLGERVLDAQTHIEGEEDDGRDVYPEQGGDAEMAQPPVLGRQWAPPQTRARLAYWAIVPGLTRDPSEGALRAERVPINWLRDLGLGWTGEGRRSQK